MRECCADATYLENIKCLAEHVQAFYFKPNPNSAVFGYPKSPVGINTLNRILPDMLCGQAALKGKMSYCFKGNLRVVSIFGR